MSRTGITYEQVALAAEQLLLENTPPTIEKIRIHLGSTGSYGTIAKHLNAWKMQRLVASADTAKITAAPDPVNLAVNRVWQEMREEAAKEIGQLKAAFLEEKTNLETQLANLQNEHTTTINEQNELKSQLQATLTEKELLVIDLRKNQQDTILLQEKEQGLMRQLEQAKTDFAITLANLKTAHEQAFTKLEQTVQESKSHYETSLMELKQAYDNERQHFLQLVDTERTQRLKQVEINNALNEKLSGAIQMLTETTHLNQQTKIALSKYKQKEEQMKRELNEALQQQTKLTAISEQNQLLMNKLADMEIILSNGMGQQNQWMHKLQQEVLQQIQVLLTWRKQTECVPTN